MEKLVMLLQFIVGLSLIVGIHELGHMLMARLFGIRVDHFMIGFPPKIFKFKIGHTEYALGAIPLGGSAKIAGMVDESFDTKTLKSEPEKWEYRAKPRWQRLIVVLGGIIFNMICGILIFIGLAKFVGNFYIPKEELNKHGIYPTKLGNKLGFKIGDKILKLNGKEFEGFENLQSTPLFLKGNTIYTVFRKDLDATVEIKVTKDVLKYLNSSKSQAILFTPLTPYEIQKVDEVSSASKANIKKGDKIVSINDFDSTTIETLKINLKKFAGKKAFVKFIRDEQEFTTLLDINPEAKIGIYLKPTLHRKNKKFALLKAIPWGFKTAFTVVWTNILAIKHMITGDLSFSKSLKGPVGIIQVFGTSFNWIKFWNIIAFLSMIIAFTNLLPIPALDGGHMVLLIYEMVTGKELSQKTLVRFQIVGAVILLSIIAFTLFNDIIKLIKK